MAYEEPLTGRIVNICEHEAFIAPYSALPPGFPQNCNVYLAFSAIRLGILPLRADDKVEFVLGDRDKAKPRALTAKRTSCATREGNEVDQFFREISSKLANINDDDMLELIACPAAWNVICKSPHIKKEENIRVLVKTLLKLNSFRRNLQQHVNDFFHAISTTSLFDPDKGHLMEFIKSYDKYKNDALICEIKDLLLIFLEIVPIKRRSLIKFIKFFLNRQEMKDEFYSNVLDKLVMNDAAISDDINECPWNEMPSVPSKNDLSNNAAELHLLPVRTNEPYKSADEYMSTYFRLLWADAFHALRTGIHSFLSGQLDHKDMHVYHSVSLVNICLDRFDDGVMLQIKVTHQSTNINWELSSALMYGNLLCLSSTGTFKDTIYATVAKRDVDELKRQGLIVIRLLNGCNDRSPAENIISLFTNSGHTVMVESPTYYNAYQPVLKALQSFKLEELPFQEEIVFCKQKFINEYLKIDGSMNTDKMLQEIDEIVANCDVQPDQFQAAALRYALCKRVACIQGPPGTGKTFIGVLLARILLQFSDISKPILVLTYKNHALDEFLKHILEYFPHTVARVGGRCHDPQLQHCTLSELRKRHKKSNDLWDAMQEIDQTSICVKQEIINTLKLLKSRSVFTIDSFIQYLPVQFCQTLISEFYSHNKDKLNNKILKERDAFTLGKLLHGENVNMKSLINSEIFLKAYSAWLPDIHLAHKLEQVFIPQSDYTIKEENSEKHTDLVQQEDEDEEGSETEEERFQADENGIRNFMNMSQVNFQFSKEEMLSHRLLSSARQMVANKPVSTYMLLNPWKLDQVARIVLIQWILLQQTRLPRQTLNELFSTYQNVCKARRELEDRHSVHILQGMSVIGMTITGASLYSNLLSSVRCPITIVEEAAEILEPQLVAAIGPWSKHLILIGDHQQLRPPVENYHLRKEYNFDISLMERLINNKLPYKTLGFQNRMRPEFVTLLLDIYPNIRSNLSRVENNKPPPCINKTFFFWNHIHNEIKSRSFTNPMEADMVLKLALFFVRSGYSPSKITILTAYRGQTRLLRKMMRDAGATYSNLFSSTSQIDATPDNTKNNLGAITRKRSMSVNSNEPSKPYIQVHTIDMFQGDENDIIIISLVRCNKEKNAGFLKLLNRRCVAQSRARCGMYFVGNRETLESNEHWNRLIKKMDQEDCVGPSITICCPYHNYSRITASQSGDIPIQESYCTVTCKQSMSCGQHYCDRPCQPDHSHEKCSHIVRVVKPICGHLIRKECSENMEAIICQRPCSKMMSCGLHRCSKTCGDEHQHRYCAETVEFTFSRCNHLCSRMCWQSESGMKCEKTISFEFEGCGHVVDKLCYEDTKKMTCKEPCKQLISCGHLCTRLCYQPCMNSDECEKCKERERLQRLKMKAYEEKIRKMHIEAAQKEIKDLKAKLYDDRITRTELTPDGENAHTYNKLRDMVCKFIQAEHHWRPEVTKIEEVKNRKLELRWHESKLTMFGNPISDLKFHGTKADNVDAIITDGFQLPKTPGMFGCGIYFATDSSKSQQYSKDSNMLLVCDVLLGKINVVESADPVLNADILQQKGYDSVYARRDTKISRGVKFDEYVVYDPSRALPKYIIHYISHRIRK